MLLQASHNWQSNCFRCTSQLPRHASHLTNSQLCIHSVTAAGLYCAVGVQGCNNSSSCRSGPSSSRSASNSRLTPVHGYRRSSGLSTFDNDSPGKLEPDQPNKARVRQQQQHKHRKQQQQQQQHQHQEQQQQHLQITQDDKYSQADASEQQDLAGKQQKRWSKRPADIEASTQKRSNNRSSASDATSRRGSRSRPGSKPQHGCTRQHAQGHDTSHPQLASSDNPGLGAATGAAAAAAFPITPAASPFKNARDKTFQQLQHAVAVHGSSARIADITAVMSRLKYVEWESLEDKLDLLQQLWQLLQPQLPYAAPRHCAEAMLTANKLNEAPEGLFEACVQQFVQRVDKADSRILSNAIYAVAKAPSGSVPAASLQQVHDVLRPAFMQRAPELLGGSRGDSQSVANFAYALALFYKNRHSESSSSSGSGSGISQDTTTSSSSGSNSDWQQLQQLLQAVKPSLWADAKAQEVSNTLWACGILGVDPQQHLQALIARSLATAAESKTTAQDIGSGMYGLALLQKQLQPQQHAELTSALLEKQPDAQAISNFLWATGKMGLQLQQGQVDKFVGKLLQCAPQELLPQGISMTLWSVATMEWGIQRGALLQLLQQLAAADAAPSSGLGPQALSLSLWAAAKLKAELPTPLLDQLYGKLAAVANQADPQSLSNALWAAAVMLPQPYLPTALIGEQHSAQRQQRKQKGPREGGEMRVKQRQCLQQQALAAVVAKVDGMKPLELSNVALALAMLGLRRTDILGPVYEAAMRHLDSPEACSSRNSDSAGVSSSAVGEPASSTSKMGPQALCNLCWAGAILDLRDHQHQLRTFAQACVGYGGPTGGSTGPEEEGVQLYQLHLWLTELVGAEGLERVFTSGQLRYCRDCMRRVVRNTARPSQLQVQVWEAAQQIQGLQDVQLEAVTEDGLLSVDIAAMMAVDVPVGGLGGRGDAASGAGGTSADNSRSSEGRGGVQGAVLLQRELQQQQLPQGLRRVAFEVDGPYHYRRPDMQITGPTRFRDRMLACLGYIVVKVPFYEWQGLQDGQRVAYLQQALESRLGRV